tara:strand:- start:1040 stop:3421 length:2382 start_codon:yes stop_codon:yes gene_type:complete
MKNKLFLIILSFFIFCNTSLSESLKFNTENISITEQGNIINAGKGKVITTDNNYEIFANSFLYNKDLELLTSQGNGIFVSKSENIKIKFDNANFDLKNSFLEAEGNVKILQLNNKFEIKSDKVVYNKEKNIISTNTQTELFDHYKNNYIVESLIYEIDNDLIKLTNVFFENINNDNFQTPIAFVNTKSEKLFAKDIILNLDNSMINNNNQPRLKGNSLINDNDIAKIKKGVFTTCKKRDGCPPWQLEANEIKHDKKKKIIYYDKATLKVYDFPVLYFPKFFHPDPTVTRQSGFLIPSIKNSKSSNYLNTPYFFAIANNKDATFSPRFYDDKSFLIQSEYREVNKESSHFVDASFLSDENGSTEDHLFYNFNKSLIFNNFDNSKLNFKFQNLSNDTYIKANKLKSPLIEDESSLENSINLDFYSDSLSLNINSVVYEDLNKTSNDRYEYILPQIELIKQIENKTELDGYFTLSSSTSVKNYNTNIDEKLNINDLLFTSNSKINDYGLYSNYEFLVKNSNTDTDNSDNFKPNSNHYLSGIFQYNSFFPLIKKNENLQKILTPRMSFKIAPKHTKDVSNKNFELDVNNIYNINRATSKDAIEGGVSFTYGSDFSIVNLDKSLDILNLKFANNFRLEENEDLPKNNQINQKTSNFFSEITYNPNEFLSTKYNSSLKNNLSDLSYENLIAQFKINNLVTTFDYLNENNYSNENSFLSSTVEYSMNESNSLSFSTRKNKTIDLTEYYNLMYQYKNDCLSASIEYDKEYYSDRDLKPNETLFFKLTIIPFGSANSPNLSK